MVTWGVWQAAQPMAVKSASPCAMSGAASGSGAGRGGGDSMGGGGGGGRRGGPPANEIGDEVDGIVAEFGVGRGVDALRERGAVGAALAGVRRGGDPHLVEEGEVGKVVQRGHVRLATESPRAAVGSAAHPARDAVAVAVVGICGLVKCLLGHQIGRSQPEQEGDRKGRDVRGGRRDRVALDAELREGGRRLSPQILAALAGENVATFVRQPARRLDHELLTRPAGRRECVAGAALVLVEEGPRSFIHREHAVEERAAGVEAREFLVGQARHRVADCSGFRKGPGASRHGRQQNYGTNHENGARWVLELFSRSMNLLL